MISQDSFQRQRTAGICCNVPVSFLVYFVKHCVNVSLAAFVCAQQSFTEAPEQALCWALKS